MVSNIGVEKNDFGLTMKMKCPDFTIHVYLCSTFCLLSVPSHLTISSIMSPHTTTAGLGMDTKHHTSLPYTTSPYHLSPPAHSSPSPSDHHSSPSPRHDNAMSPPATTIHSQMWLGAPRESKKSRDAPANDQDGPLNLSKPRPDFFKRDPNDERHGHSIHYNGSDKVTTPPPAHSNHRANSNISNASSTPSSNHSGLSSPIMSSTPPKVSLTEAPSPLFARPPFLPPQYNPFLGLAGHLPVSVLNNNFTAAHSAFLMNAGKIPGMDTDKVGQTVLQLITISTIIFLNCLLKPIEDKWVTLNSGYPLIECLSRSKPSFLYCLVQVTQLDMWISGELLASETTNYMMDGLSLFRKHSCVKALPISLRPPNSTRPMVPQFSRALGSPCMVQVPTCPPTVWARTEAAKHFGQITPHPTVSLVLLELLPFALWSLTEKLAIYLFKNPGNIT